MFKSTKTKVVALVLSLTLVLISGYSLGSVSNDEAMVYILNYKPEIHSQLDAIAKKYEEETGVVVKVTTAASGQYQQTLTSEIVKKDAPTIFQINGPVDYSTWHEYCADLSDTQFYNMLTEGGKDLTIDGDDGGVYGIPYTVEAYGIIYNDAIMQKYFASKNKSTEFNSVDEIKGFDDLKAVTEDMTLLKDELGIEGVFASTSMAEGNMWRWQAHLLNLPLYYEFSEGGQDALDVGLEKSSIDFEYNQNFKNIFDLYTDNSITDKNKLSSKTVDDSMSEFALGKVAMVQNGNWSWGQISGIDGNTTKMEDVKFMPIYTGVDGEENQGVCIGTESYYCINSQVSQEKQQASLDFLTWLFSSEEGKKVVSEEFGFITPFNTFDADEIPQDNLSQEIIKYSTQSEPDTYYPEWVHIIYPSEAFKNDVGSSLLEYVQDQKTWDEVVQDVINSWSEECAATKRTDGG